ncbi:MAG TPA: hypothetical protein VHB48_09305 [Chitinophagaceae bacterium]|nr:hypothetical protein [Chitinophagaceae bacterium]
MKKILTLSVVLLMVAGVVKAAEPETKMEKSFRELFPNAQHVKWHQDGKGFLVSFSQSGMQVKIQYDNKGNFMQSLRYYSAKDLPTSILLSVKNKYPGKDIFGVTEQATANDLTYHIVLLDGESPVNIAAFSDGSVKEEQVSGETDEN